MKFKVDENLPIDLVALLDGKGFDAVTVTQQGLSGEIDIKVAQVCQREERILITLDLDFADIRGYPPKEYPGIIVMRLYKQDKYRIMAIFEILLPLLDIEQLDKRLWIVEENRVRIRGG